MKKLIFIIIFILGIVFAIEEYPDVVVKVNTTGAPFLLISPSPTMNGFGGSGVSMISNDVYSVHYNPALPQLQSGFCFTSSNTSTYLYPNLADDILLESNVKQIGYNGYSYKNLKLQFALTWYKTDLDFAFGTYANSMKADATSFALGIQFKDRPIYLSLGRTNKTAIQYFGQGAGSEHSNVYSKDKFYDWGFRFLINNYPLFDDNKIGLTFALGYSKSNIGDFISFQDESQGDPAPMTARLGLTWGANFLIFDKWDIKLKFINEATDLLVETLVDSLLINGEIQYEYERVYQKGLFGDINISDHILSGDTGVAQVNIHRGFEVSLFNICYFRQGSKIDWSGIDIETVGFGVNISNLFRVLPLFREENFSLINNVLNYVDIQFNSSRWGGEQGFPWANTTYDEYTIILKNIDKLIWD